MLTLWPHTETKADQAAGQIKGDVQPACLLPDNSANACGLSEQCTNLYNASEPSLPKQTSSSADTAASASAILLQSRNISAVLLWCKSWSESHVLCSPGAVDGSDTCRLSPPKITCLRSGHRHGAHQVATAPLLSELGGLILSLHASKGWPCMVHESLTLHGLPVLHGMLCHAGSCAMGQHLHLDPGREWI